MVIIYRTSPDGSGYNKQKPDYINERNCLKNFVHHFLQDSYQTLENYDKDDDRPILNVVADISYFNSKDISFVNGYLDDLGEIVKHSSITVITAGSGAKSFNHSLDLALTFDDDETVYLVENDYIHLPNSMEALLDGLNFGDYVSLYNHPDKFIPPSKGGNPYVDGDGGFHSKLYSGESCIWMVTNSTTGTFAATVKTLKEDISILREFTQGDQFRDFAMFIALQKRRARRIVTPIPTFATHGETAWLAKYVDWDDWA